MSFYRGFGGPPNTLLGSTTMGLTTRITTNKKPPAGVKGPLGPLLRYFYKKENLLFCFFSDWKESCTYITSNNYLVVAALLGATSSTYLQLQLTYYYLWAAKLLISYY